MASYLDKTGLAYFWEKTKSFIRDAASSASAYITEITNSKILIHAKNDESAGVEIENAVDGTSGDSFVNVSFVGSGIVRGINHAIKLINDSWSNESQSQVFMTVENTSTGKGVRMGIDAAGSNRGLFDGSSDNNSGDWIIYRDSSGNTIVPGDKWSVNANGDISGRYYNGEYQTTVKGRTKTLALRANTNDTMGLYDVTDNDWILYKASDDTAHLKGDWYVTDQYNKNGTNLRFGVPADEDLTGSQSVATGVDTTIGSFTLSPGKWVAIVKVVWPTSRVGRRAVNITTNNNEGSGASYNNYGISVPATDGASSGEYVPIILEVGSATRLYLRAWQNSGSSLTASYRVRLIRQH